VHTDIDTQARVATPARSAPARRRPGRLSGALSIAVVLVFSAALNGCTSSGAGTPNTTSTASSAASPAPTTTSSAATSAIPGSTTSTPAVSTTTVTPTPTSTKPTPTSTKPTKTLSPPTSNPWPATLTPGEVTQAKAAIAAYTAYYALVDRAFAQPGKDWAAPLAKVAADPEKSSIARYLTATAKLGQYRTGHIAFTPRVSKVQTGVVDLTVCVDSTNVGFFDKTGKSIKAPNAPGSYYRHPSKVQVLEYVGNKWLVTRITSDFTKSC
jgi:hypothetical protein